MWRRVPVGVIVYVLFTDSTLTIATVDGQDDRGFGYGVMADGVYNRISRAIPDHFVDMQGTRVHFNQTRP
jgi:hypothetical protein